MNFSSILGLILAVTVLVGTILSSTGKDSLVFLDLHAFMIVIGGTLAASLLSFSLTKILTLVSPSMPSTFKFALDILLQVQVI